MHPTEAASEYREREIFIDNLLVRVNLIIEMSGPALHHGSLNSLFQVALYLICTFLVSEYMCMVTSPIRRRTSLGPYSKAI